MGDVPNGGLLWGDCSVSLRVRAQCVHVALSLHWTHRCTVRDVAGLFGLISADKMLADVMEPLYVVLYLYNARHHLLSPPLLLLPSGLFNEFTRRSPVTPPTRRPLPSANRKFSFLMSAALGCDQF